MVLLTTDVLMLFVLVPKKSATDLLSSEKSFKRVKKTHGQILILVLSSLERHKQAVLCLNQIAVKIGAFFLINIWRHMNSRLAAVQVIFYLHIRYTFKLLASHLYKSYKEVILLSLKKYARQSLIWSHTTSVFYTSQAII